MIYVPVYTLFKSEVRHGLLLNNKCYSAELVEALMVAVFSRKLIVYAIVKINLKRKLKRPSHLQ